MKYYFHHIKILLKRFLLLLILFSISRLYFFLINYNHFDSLVFWEIIKLHFIGIQFDISSLIFYNLVFIILHIIPGEFKNNILYQRIIKIFYISVNILLLFTNIIDVEYFKFTNKRTTADIIQYIILNDQDITNLIPHFIADFWYHLIALGILICALIFFYPSHISHNIKSKVSTLQYVLQTILIIPIFGVLILGARGIGYKPLRIIDAVKYTDAKNAPLVLNTPFTLLKTFGNKDLVQKNYYTNEELHSIYAPICQFNPDDEFKNFNVIIIILESFGKEYIGSLNNNEGYTPFLDSLIKQSLVFPNAYANGKRSIEAMPSIISSLPTLMDNSLISSSFTANKYTSLPNILKTKGYQSSFFHGGNNGTMGFDNFAEATNFDFYYGRNEYNNEEDFDGSWGILDEEFMQFMANELNTFKEPFFSTLFTLSSHHPYPVPKKYNNLFKDGPLPILKSIRYTDYALKKFFETIERMPWYKNTLFVITADHTAQAMEKFYTNKLGIYSIPILYFCPSDENLKGVNNKITQQIDIMPSILDYLNYENEFISFGKSIFDTTKNNFAINYADNLYQLICNNHTVHFDGEKSIAAYNILSDSLLQNNLIGTSNQIIIQNEIFLKGFIQSYNNRMINNQLYIKMD